MTKTIQQLREERGESRAALARVMGVTPKDVADWEMGRTEPTFSRLRLLTEHFRVRDDQIDLRPGHRRSLGEQLRDALTE
jgi:transcriptional regulator with XRE-family HTH domain